ncbi:MAG: uroporphyrinogen-III C-methyltransferase [candidate division NC10 bacterium]|nr:uroporphyrinogen-III C-methyltransferase [candidate division NC10 bacterium]
MKRSREKARGRDRKLGFVSLVGAGPGDPGLLTLRGLECLRRAEVLIYDYLVNERLLGYAPAGAELIYAGKKGGQHALEQEEISALLLDRAKQGKRVVRLKGGDPFLFGRGGEEAEELASAGVPFEVVPGVTSAIAVPAYAGIPLTHRRYTSTVGLITGHQEAGRSAGARRGREGSKIAWEKVATGLGTLVFLMGYGQLKSITENLMREGRDPDTPVALIRWGTTPSQETLVGSLKDIAQRAEEAHFSPPVVIVAGEVVGLRSALNWFEERPLFGKRILVTRAREQASALVRLLEAEGAEAIPLPVIEIQPLKDYGKLDQALTRIESYHWVIFTSVHGVAHFWGRLRKMGKDARALKGVRLVAIGPATAAALQGCGVEPDLIPLEFRAEAILKAMQKEDLREKWILLPRAAQARDLLPDELRRRGARVQVVEAYRVVRPEADFRGIRERLRQGEIDVITFTSSSTVHHFMEGMGKKGADGLGKRTVIACIGPITAATAKEHGLKVAIQPQQYTIPSLVEAICSYFGKGEGKR